MRVLLLLCILIVGKHIIRITMTFITLLHDLFNKYMMLSHEIRHLLSIDRSFGLTTLPLIIVIIALIKDYPPLIRLVC
jgi:hypothetical protein